MACLQSGARICGGLRAASKAYATIDRRGVPVRRSRGECRSHRLL